MADVRVKPINEELRFLADEVIVSKTDRTGRILYANDVFCRMAEMTTAQVIGQPHSIIRHPDMPRAVFKLLWDTIGSGREIFTYVKNMSATGRFYWVIAHVTPTLNNAGAIIGYHSNRRVPSPRGVAAIVPLYKELLAEEARHANSRDGLAASTALLNARLTALGQTYDEFIWSLENDVV